ncbi:hypothetical protein [Amycolatopsis sp. H20-H5]|uniref:hypothetical protein n=1 Tax=Amycolatopsis sp. H20-H5 TaxID=3046309 RepID=UPI002DBF52CA|nr:hypothetical protein [Amycolatopsis sp. H20-H5]MEC3977873.1 hypothetical protein [Amycolatopsis sp. H20-H5]
MKSLPDALTEWAASLDDGNRAAVRLLIEHDFWLHRKDFLEPCVHVDRHGMAWVSWPTAGELLERAEFDVPDSALALLDFAICLAEDAFRLSRLEPANRALVVGAVIVAVGGDRLAVRTDE